MDLTQPAMQIPAHQFVQSRHRVVGDGKRRDAIWAKMQRTLDDLPRVLGFGLLFQDLNNPWYAHHIRKTRDAEWARASQKVSRKIPSIKTGKGQFFPPALRLQSPWERISASRYYFNSFPTPAVKMRFGVTTPGAWTEEESAASR